MSGKQIALAAGVSDSAISLMKSGKRKLSIDQLRHAIHRLSSQRVADVLAWLTGCRPDVAIIPNGERAANPLRQCAAVQRELAELCDEVAVAMSDGHISEAERLAIEHHKHRQQLAVSRV